MSVFYKCFKRSHELQDENAPVIRAIQLQNKNHFYVIHKLCVGILEQFSYNDLRSLTGSMIIEMPFEKMPNGNIVYQILPKNQFNITFTPVTVDPWILSGGRDLTKCEK